MTQGSGDSRPPGRAGLSVVVPAWNAGEYLDRCLRSLLDQTLDRSRFDVIAVDDGSTDGTGERLDRAAGEHPDLIRVEHTPNSGWAGRPRNVGTGLSEREYVFYCDADDWLLPHALEAMLDQAEAERADVLLPRVVGRRRKVGLALFEKGDYCTTRFDTPDVFSTLTCQKLFRRRFLVERDVRFAEERVRLEDFLFMTTAYLRAQRISILGSRPCYVLERRDDGGNLTSTPATEDDYFATVEAIMDVILAETEPGEDQGRTFDRVLRSELVGPLSRPSLLAKAPKAQVQALAHGQRLLRTKVPESAVAFQDPTTRNRIRAIEQGDLRAISRTIRAEQAVTTAAQVSGVSWAGGAVRIDLRLALHRDGRPITLAPSRGALVLPGALAGAEPIDMTTPFAASYAMLHLRNRERPDEWRIAVPLTASDVVPPTLDWDASVTIDVHTLAGGQALRTGVWDTEVVLNSCGLRRPGPLRAPGGVDLEVDPASPNATVHDGLRLRPYWTKSGCLALSVRESSGAPRSEHLTDPVVRRPASRRRAVLRSVVRAVLPTRVRAVLLRRLRVVRQRLGGSRRRSGLPG